MKRFIVPIPLMGIKQVPDQAVVVDGYFDYIDESNPPNPTPADAIYASTWDGKGEEVVEKNQIAGKITSKHTFAGWKSP